MRCANISIVVLVATRQAAGGVKAPPPIVSRIFQEISNGMLAYNHACKMKEVPVPFALVHFNALLLLLFNMVTPVVITCFTGNVQMSVFASVVVTSGFSALCGCQGATRAQWSLCPRLLNWHPDDLPMQQIQRPG